MNARSAWATAVSFRPKYVKSVRTCLEKETEKEKLFPFVCCDGLPHQLDKVQNYLRQTSKHICEEVFSCVE